MAPVCVGDERKLVYETLVDMNYWKILISRQKFPLRKKMFRDPRGGGLPDWLFSVCCRKCLKHISGNNKSHILLRELAFKILNLVLS